MLKIQEVKKRILEQAVKGLLVTQNEEESVDSMIASIKSQRDGLIRTKKIRKPKPLQPIEDDEVPYVIPSTWKWVRIGDCLLNIIGGGTPSKANESYWNGDIPWASVKDMDSSMHLSTTLDSISEEGLNNSSSNLIEKGNIIVSTRMGLGKVKINTVDVAINQDLKALILPNEIDTKYFYYCYKTLSIEGSGMTVKGIRQDELLSLPFPLPPYEEQVQIAKKIDELFILCEQLEDEIKFQQKHIRTLRNKLFDDALQGLLVTQNEEAEPASVLLQKIQEERERLVKEKVIRKTKPLPTIEESDIPHELPSGWTWVRIGDIATINPRNAIDDDLEVGFVPMKLIEDGYSGKHMSEPRKWKDVKRGFTHFQENDIAIAKITPCFENKKSTIMKDLPNRHGAGTTELHIVRPFHEYVLADYLMCLFKSNTFIEKGVQSYTGTAGQQRVGKDFIENYVIGLPPIEEQHRIVEKVNTVWETINEIESNIVSAK
ncbi:restriction endonuclease subunit S [Bacillus badius]|uniref:restriction endonuclease subunit S n=1 Tax=Bacillus badius TaxID=1455 RepID=UPI002E21A164|nr:restriction endonuclease subunit S [Bacillus badius]MED0666060.1 restriction endonuclease subunit S [Bacillus badius]